MESVKLKAAVKLLVGQILLLHTVLAAPPTGLPVHQVMQMGRALWNSSEVTSSANGILACYNIPLLGCTFPGIGKEFDAIFTTATHMDRIHSETNGAIGFAFASKDGETIVCGVDISPANFNATVAASEALHPSMNWLHVYPPTFDSKGYLVRLDESGCNSIALDNIDISDRVAVLSITIDGDVKKDGSIVPIVWIQKLNSTFSEICWRNMYGERSDIKATASLLLISMSSLENYVPGKTAGPEQNEDFEVGKITVPWSTNADILGFCQEIVFKSIFDLSPFVFASIEYESKQMSSIDTAIVWVKSTNNFGTMICVASSTGGNSTIPLKDITIHYLAVANVQSAAKNQLLQHTEIYLKINGLIAKHSSDQFEDSFVKSIAEVSGLPHNMIEVVPPFNGNEFYIRLYNLSESRPYAVKIRDFFANLSPEVNATQFPQTHNFLKKFGSDEFHVEDADIAGSCVLGRYDATKCSTSNYGTGGMQHLKREVVVPSYGSTCQKCETVDVEQPCHSGHRIFNSATYALKANLNRTGYIMLAPPMKIGTIIGLAVSSITVALMLVGSIFHFFSSRKYHPPSEPLLP